MIDRSANAHYIGQLERDNAELLQQLDRYTRLSESGESLGDALDMAEELESLRKQLEQAEARIDSLMLEYCPGEMTTAQIERWAKHQTKEATSPASPQSSPNPQENGSSNP